MTELDLSPRASVADAPTPAKRRRRNIAPMIVLALVLVAGGVIVTQFLATAVDYFCNVDEIGERDGCETERRIRLQGTVDAGSVDETPGRTAFSMSYNGVSIDVEYAAGDGRPGGIFEECQPVVVHGEIRDGVLYGDNIEVKHSEEYEAESGDNLDAAYEGADATCPT
ncbi:MAG: cytochrome c maturation protein CcmE [Actinomycetota bacterium]